ncbi:MAG: threonine--tRNA ligase, partial [Cyanobacteria bacterium P01_F01_bin.153]
MAQTQDQTATMSISLPKTSESESINRIRNTASLVMAIAVQQLFSKAQVTVGQCTENGYYYDFDNPEPFAEKELKTIKKAMIKVINKKMAV